ncbi:MAG: hypothetical protein HPY83_15945 [Anaerolineae bacterium]|nr:hypothetical protein [Anaerolineae bacterium]
MVTGARRLRFLRLLRARVSLYAVHFLPDVHPEVGKSVEVARVLGLTPETWLRQAGGRLVGLSAGAPAGTALDRLRHRMGEPLASPAAAWASRGATTSGKAVGRTRQTLASVAGAVARGELQRTVCHPVKEAELGVVLGGRRLTKTVGLKTLACSLGTVWVEAPIGL